MFIPLVKASISNNQNLKEMIRFNAKQLIEGIKIEMGKNEVGIEPRDILMNASLNIITYFVLGETLVFDQPEFKERINTNLEWKSFESIKS